MDRQAKIERLRQRDSQRTEEALERRAEHLRRSFAAFARWGWPRVTGLAFPDNPASRALVAALQAVADGRIWRLLVAISPGIGKSTMLALYSSWRIARRADWRSLHAMSASADANRESLRVRRLVTHADFVQLFPDVALAVDENTVQAWATTKGGRYTAVGTDTAITSKRVLEIVLDDPMNALDRYSKTERSRVAMWLFEGAMSRLDGDRAPIIIVAQRLDKDDIHARCLSSGEHWAMLEPAAERDSRGLELRDHAGDLVWSDDREPDELIAPQMLSREKLHGLAKSVRITQYQQRPDEDAGGGTIARDAWRFHAPDGANSNAARPKGCAGPDISPTVITPSHYERIVISLDPTFGGTKSSNDFASLQVWGAVGRGRYLIERWKERSKQALQRTKLKEFRAKYPYARLLIEKSAGGLGMIEELEGEGVKNIEGVAVGTLTGGKPARLDNVSPGIEQGFVYIPLGMPGLQDFVDEIAGMNVHDDDMDAASQALHWLNSNPGRTGDSGAADGGDASISTTAHVDPDDPEAAIERALSG
jgi:predicted phage terminase large subunit-like protein